MVIRGLLHYIVSRREEKGLVHSAEFKKFVADAKKEKQSTTLLVDLRGFCNWMYPKVLSGISSGSKVPQHVISISGGDYNTISVAVANFVDALEQLGVTLDFFMDTDGGCSIRDAFPDRVDLWRRRNARTRQVNGTVKELEKFQFNLINIFKQNSISNSYNILFHRSLTIN